MTKTNRTAKTLGLSALAGLLLAAPGSALAQGAAAPTGDEDVMVSRSVGPGPLVHVVGGPGMLPLGPAANGIPPHVVEKLNIPRNLVQKVQDLTFQSNDALISLEGDLKRAQLVLERLLSAPSPDENAILKQVEEVGRAETAVRKNRMSLMVQVKKVLGPELWQKLEAELGPVRVERRIVRRLGTPGGDDALPPELPEPPAPQRRP